MKDKSKRLSWFKARFDWSELFKELDDGELRILVDAIWLFAEKGEESEDIPKSLKLAWKLVKAELAQDVRDRENGKKGGNPLLKVSTGVEPGLKGGSIEKRREEKEKNREDIYISTHTKSGKRFVPPTPEDVKAYANSLGKEIDADRFCDYYQTRGWTVGKGEGRKMKDWKASVRMWLSDAKKSEGGDNGNHGNGFNAGRI